MNLQFKAISKFKKILLGLLIAWVLAWGYVLITGDQIPLLPANCMPTISLFPPNEPSALDVILVTLFYIFLGPFGPYCVAY